MIQESFFSLFYLRKQSIVLICNTVFVGHDIIPKEASNRDKSLTRNIQSLPCVNPTNVTQISIKTYLSFHT
jgi:hypothetical protein